MALPPRDSHPDSHEGHRKDTKKIITSKQNRGKMREDIINLSNAGLAVEEIAEELGCSEEFAFSVLGDAGLL